MKIEVTEDELYLLMGGITLYMDALNSRSTPRIREKYERLADLYDKLVDINNELSKR